MAKINFTKEQQLSIDARGGNILVSAAAGSGKTAVLSQRVISRLLFDSPFIPADKLMIVTFTKASAAEMKSRILKKLTDYAIENPESELCRQQISLFERAKIGTIHSCCTEILRDNFNLCSLPSDFRIGDPDEIKAIRQNCVKAVLEECYSENTPEFISLAQLLGGKKDDLKLEDAIVKIIDFAQSVPFYKDWMENICSKYLKPTEIGTTVWEDIIFKQAEREVVSCLFLLESAIEIINSNSEIEPYLAAFENDKEIFL